MASTLDVDWAAIAASRRFITALYAGSAPRPGVLYHYDSGPLPPPPAALGDAERAVWSFTEALRRRPLGEDDFVPAIGTGAGTCAMATAFGCAEREVNGVYWATPAITDAAQIDHLRPPPVTAGKLGAVLAQTRAYARLLDPRIGVRIMDFQSPFTTVEQLLGSELFFLMPVDQPRRLHAIMDVVTDFAIAFFRAQFAAAGEACCPGLWPTFWFPRGAGIQMSDDNLCNVSPAVYDEFVVPYNNRIAEAFGGLFLHSCTITERQLPSLRKLTGLTGINCDISTSVSVGTLLREFGQRAVVAPHAYINTATNFQSYAEFFAAVLRDWQPGQRLFIHPCSVLYLPHEQRDLRFDLAAARAAMAPYRRNGA